MSPASSNGFFLLLTTVAAAVVGASLGVLVMRSQIGEGYGFVVLIVGALIGLLVVNLLRRRFDGQGRAAAHRGDAWSRSAARDPREPLPVHAPRAGWGPDRAPSGAATQRLPAGSGALPPPPDAGPSAPARTAAPIAVAEPPPPSSAVDLPNWWSGNGAPPGDLAVPSAPDPAHAPAAPPNLGGRRDRRVVQCPYCPSLRIDLRHTPQGVDFTCYACGHQWSWAPGRRWPVATSGRPDRPASPDRRA